MTYLAGLGSTPFDTNAGVNLPAAQATAPVITNNTTGTTSVSPSFLQQLGTFFSSAAPLAAAVVPGITGTPAKTAATAAKPAATTASAVASSIFSSPMMLIGLIGGGVLLLVLLLRRK